MPNANFCLLENMKIFSVSSFFLFSTIILALLGPISTAKLITSERRILFQAERLLEYPQVLRGWRKWTNFCYLPPSPSLKIVCSNGHVTELTIVGDKVSSSSSQTLSERFSIDSFFTVLTKLSSLKVLSLVSLGLWGPLPAKIDRFWSLEVLNISSNHIDGEIPSSIRFIKSLRVLNLADNLFNGSVPDLKALAFLEELNLGENKLGSEFPSLGNNLVRIILKYNSFRFQIPSRIMYFHKLEEFDISSNEFSGPIPPSLFSLPSIVHINLAQNQLTGDSSVNINCSSKLTFVNLSDNLLMGKFPPCFGSSKSSNRTVLYSGNCFSARSLTGMHQHPSSYCIKEKAIAVKPVERSQKKETGMRILATIGVIGGSVGFAVILSLFIVFVWRKCKEDRADDDKDLDRSATHKLRRPNIDSRRVPQTMRLSALGLPPYRIFSSEDIEEATNNFDPSNLISEGSKGKIYKGWLSDGSEVLFNCVEVTHKNLTQSLMKKHIEVLPCLRHRHLVSVLGHCIITPQDHSQPRSTVFIVLERFSNGSLRYHLSDLRKKQVLKWPQRMAISIGIARGTQFLHTGVVPGIFGNDLKIDNILLDDNLNPKVSGYNIPLLYKNGFESTLLEQSGPHHGARTDPAAEKEDIYQLGVILLEVITGKRLSSSSEIEDLKDELERGLSEAASTLRSAIDPTIQGTYAYESLRTAIQITINCLCEVPNKRPSIEDVLWNLQYSLQVQESWTSSGNLGTKF
ncbi:probable LRR receptor-like serine/threonine-protein kinase At1g14390 [Prosopis cineraria]|uniref:probable LRR receptor-like serine/threonine-protein kinase At1g14390 n=1 Tax=Prosopis cineraria TaxID=364024 RepID=UPI0024101820|nr:probable LRR receptor-like serine/threonine-protein kinase At1g14390 [Prosopis cineraria]